MYIIIWEFQIKQGYELEFELRYGPNGEWAKLFKRGEGFVGTELLHDLIDNTYLTIGRWESKNTYEAFRKQWAKEYERLDEQCDALTEKETKIGLFRRI